MRFGLVVILSMLIGIITLASGAPYAQASAESSYAALKSVDFTALPVASAQINQTAIVRVKPDLPASYQAHGVINKTIGFTLAMPLDKRNGRYS